MSIEGQGHFFTIYFPGFVCFVLYKATISGERLQDHPLVSSPVTFVYSVCVRAWAAKGLSRRFRADSGMNLFKQGKNVTGLPCGLIAHWSDYSHGLRWVPVRSCAFSSPVTLR